MTATPRTYTANVKAKAEERGVEITSMDDPHIYGPQLHKLTFGEAIKQELLTDYQVVIVGVTDPQVQNLIDRRELVSVNDTVTTDARTLAAHIGLAKATKDFNLARTISFHSRIKTAAQFANDHPRILEWLPATHKPQGTTWTDTISGDMNTGQRRTLLQQLRKDQPGRHALLTNARCLTEGVDVPTLDGVAFIDPRSSQVDIIQAVGRAIRRSQTKNIGTIVLPVLIPEDANPDDALSDSAFKSIWEIVNALRSHDENLADALDELRTGLGCDRKSQVALPQKVVIDLPTEIGTLPFEFPSKLKLKLLEQTTDSWNHWYGQLVTYAAINGHSSPPQKKESTKSLAGWVNDQRMSYRGTKSKKLTLEQIARLESLPNWQWNPIDSQWSTNYEEILRYASERKSVSFKRNESNEGRQLAQWVMRQRQSYFAGTLEEEKRELLEQIPYWDWKPVDTRWEHGFRKLQEYKIQKNGSNPLPTERYRKFRLGSWVVQQRSKYRKGLLTGAQIQRLEELRNWTWDPDELEWTAKLNATYRYAQREGHTSVGAKHREDGLLIGKWTVYQRKCYKSGSLTEDQIRAIESIPGWQWHPAKDVWDTNFRALKNFTETNQLEDLPKSNLVTRKRLLGWTRTQRKRYSRGAMSSDQVTLLESIPGWYWTKSLTRWDINFNALTKYAQETGTAMAPEGFRSSDGVWLGRFCQQMRSDYRNKRLSHERITKLEKLPGWEWFPHQAEWTRKFQALRALADQGRSFTFAHRDGISQNLKTWSSAQRTAYRRGLLDNEKIELLESVKGWTWDPLQTSWEAGFQKLKEYEQRNGHTRVPHGHLLDGFNLGSWVLTQRRRYAKKTITRDQIKRLEAMDGWVWIATKSR